jgi:glutaconyl-CoA/methylmalonyl-CoA decarboxylase subunit gamma
MRKFKVSVNGVSYNVEVQEEGMVVSPTPAAAAQAPPLAAAAPAPVKVAAGETPSAAPMPGKISKILTKVGDKVKKGDILLLLEAMKMQNEIAAPVSGTVKSINVAPGQSVKPGDVMVVIA